MCRAADDAEFRLRAYKNGAVESFAKAEIFAVINAGLVFLEIYNQRCTAIRKSAFLRMRWSYSFEDPEHVDEGIERRAGSSSTKIHSED
jgi:hypothetical protein